MWIREHRLDLILAVGLSLLAAAFRLYRLDALPPGLHFDEAHNGLDALRILRGARPIFLPTNDGREVLYSYIQAGVIALFGPTVHTLRLTSVLLGVATVPLTYAFVRHLFGRRALAVVTSVLLATSLWHVALSRFGVRSVAIPLALLPALSLFWDATRQPDRVWRFVLSGLFVGLGAYIHPVNLFLPLVIVGFTAYLVMTDRARAKSYLLGLMVTGGAALLLFLPLGWYFIRHSEAPLEHPLQVSILHPERSGDRPSDALLRNARYVAQAFTIRGDHSAVANLPGRPIFDPLMAPFFLVGVGWLIWQMVNPSAGHATRDQMVLLALWIGLMLIPSAVSDDAPNFKRLPGIVPAIYLLPAGALVTSGSWLARRTRSWLATGLVTALLLASGLWTLHDYLIVYAAQPSVAHTFMVGATEKGTTVRQIAGQGLVYAAPVLMKQSVVAFHCFDLPLRTFEMREGLVWPDGAAAWYVLDPVEGDVVEAFEAEWGPWMTREDLSTRQGEPMLVLFRLPPHALIRPEYRQTARFGDKIELVGYTLDETVAPGGTSTLTLFWRAIGPLPKEYTLFVHILDQAGHRVGQQDKPPLGGSYPTSRWQPGDRIIDRFHPTVRADAPPGAYTILVGWYDLATGERLSGVDGEGQPLPEAALRLETPLYLEAPDDIGLSPSFPSACATTAHSAQLTLSRQK